MFLFHTISDEYAYEHERETLMGKNFYDFNDFGINTIVIKEHPTWLIEGKEKEGEKLMLAFRRLDGVELSAEQQAFFGKEIEKHLKSGLLLQEGKKVKLSNEGLFLANEVFCSFVAPFDEDA